MPRYSLAEICHEIDGAYLLQGTLDDVYVERMATPSQADQSAIVFISPSRHDKQDMLDSTKASIVICDDSVQFNPTTNRQCLIRVNDPKYVFAKIGNALFVERHPHRIHPTAIIHPDAKIARNVSIGPYTYIGRCEIKENTVIHGHCYFYDNVILHENVVIHAGCIIGADGLGHIQGQDGVYAPFPHLGSVVIESGVSIGTNSCIAKGALNNTTIKSNAIIDSFVQIGHNVLVEEKVLILANVVVGGSSVIKQGAVLAIGAHIADYVTVGEHAHIGPGVCVISSVAANAKVVPRLPLTLPIAAVER